MTKAANVLDRLRIRLTGSRQESKLHVLTREGQSATRQHARTRTLIYADHVSWPCSNYLTFFPTREFKIIILHPFVNAAEVTFKGAFFILSTL